MFVFFEVLSLVLMLFPALYTRREGRRLSSHLEDPLFPEMHFAKSQRCAKALGICLPLCLIASHQLAVLKIVFLLLANAAADFPYRRMVFRESWGIGTYLGHNIRFFFAFLGPWALLALIPGLVSLIWEWSGQSAAMLAAALLGTLSLAWHLASGRVFCALLAAVPLELPWLTEPFGRISANARCRRPSIFRAGPRGGFWVNAFALPSLWTPRVVFSNDLLEALGPAEATAVFAHEVGHLEHFDRKRLLLGLATQILLLAIACSVVFLLGPAAPGVILWTWLWPLVCLGSLQRSLRKNQVHEHESDLRAIQLGADPRALIDGLSKMHTLTQMPGRWASNLEAEMSHPSLVQRLRAIREAAGISPPSPPRATEPGSGGLPEALILRASDGDTIALLTHDRLHWLAGVPEDAAADPDRALAAATSRRSLLFTELLDLRLEPLRDHRWELRSTAAGGTIQNLFLRPEDTAAAKSWLRKIEPLLVGTAPGEGIRATAATTGNVLARIDGALLMILSLLPGIPGVLGISALLTLIRPAQSNLAASGLLSLLGAARALPPLADFERGSTDNLLLCLGLTLLGGSLVHLAWRRHTARVEEPGWSRWLTFGSLGLVTILSLAWGGSRFLGPAPGLQLHFWAHDMPTALTGGLALLAATATLRRSGARWLAGGLVLLVAGLAVVATPWFRLHGTNEPFASQAPPITFQPLTLELIREQRISGVVSELELAPGGHYLAWARSELEDLDDDTSAQRVYQIEADGEISAEVEGLDFEFFDDHHFGLLTAEDGGMLLWLLAVEPTGEPPPAIALPLVDHPVLRFEGTTEWRVSGWSGNELSEVELEGRLGSASFQRLSFGEPGNRTTVTHLVSPGGQRLRLENDFGFEDSMTIGLFLGLSGSAGRTEVSLGDGETWTSVASTGMGIDCLASKPPENSFYCLVRDENDTHLWRLDPTDGSLRPLASLGIYASVGRMTHDGRLFLNCIEHAGLLIDPRTLDGWWIDLPSDLGDTISSPIPGALPPEAPVWMKGLLTSALEGFSPVLETTVEGSRVAMTPPPFGDESTILVFEATR